MMALSRYDPQHHLVHGSADAACAGLDFVSTGSLSPGWAALGRVTSRCEAIRSVFTLVLLRTLGRHGFSLPRARGWPFD